MKKDSRLLHRIWEYLHHHDQQHASHAEKMISTAGGFVGVLLVLIVSAQILDFHGAALVVASMGASAVLLFATPHSALSQPWPVLGGHLISAVIGIASAKLIVNPLYAGALAVSLSIGAMHYLRCLHPPGGATALVAVVGGEPVRALGFWFLLTPVLANVLIILIVAVLANYPFKWRRYPSRLSVLSRAGREVHAEKCMIAHSDLVYALSEVDSFIDVSEEDLLQIYHLAVSKSRKSGRELVATS